MRFAVNGAHAVLEVEVDGTPRERVARARPRRRPAGSGPSCRLYSSFPAPPPEIARGPGLFDAVDALGAAVRTFAADGLPRALRLRSARGADVLRHDVLLDGTTAGWLRGRRVELEDEPTVTVDEFSMMRELVLDFSALLAEALAGRLACMA